MKTVPAIPSSRDAVSSSCVVEQSAMSPAPTNTSGEFAETAARGVPQFRGPRGCCCSVQVTSSTSSVKTGIVERRARLGLRTIESPLEVRTLRRTPPQKARSAGCRRLAPISRGPQLSLQLPCRTGARSPHPRRSANEDTACGRRPGRPELGRATYLRSPAYNPASATRQAQYQALASQPA